jgi:hypothetical protein
MAPGFFIGRDYFHYRMRHNGNTASNRRIKKQSGVEAFLQVQLMSVK